jgi:hypothetical protein
VSGVIQSVKGKAARRKVPFVAERWTCSVCGEMHEGIPLDWGFDAPVYWSEERHGEEGFHDSDTCVVPREDEGNDYFVRGLIEIPIIDGEAEDEQYFGIGAWVSLSERNFRWYMDHPAADDHEQGGPWFGWLSNSIPIYPETLSLRTNVRLRGERLRPRIQIQPSDHPLSLDQQNGVTLAQARELSARWLHL